MSNGEKDDTDLAEEDATTPDFGGETMVDVSAELKVDELVRKIDATDPDEAAHKRDARKRVEDAQEQHDKDLDSTFNINLDDDL